LFEKGLAYQKHSEVLWDPVDKTVLAREQVDEEGKSWRSGAQVEKRKLKQWYLKTTEYTQDLYENADKIIDNTGQVANKQKKWFGSVDGVFLKLKTGNGEDVSVFLKCPEAVHGVTHVVQQKYKATRQFEDDDFVIHPLTGKKLPIIQSNHYYFQQDPNRYQVPEMIFGNPSLNKQDGIDAEKLGAEQRTVFVKNGKFPSQADNLVVQENSFVKLDEHMTDHNFDYLIGEKENVIDENGDEVNRLEYRKIILEKLNTELKTELKMKSASLDDWLISRQRFWGAPIPIIHCPEHGAVPVPEQDLPVVLPETVDYNTSGKMESPLANNSDFVNCECPICGKPSKRETDTMDTFVDSSFYFNRYLSENCDSNLMGSLTPEEIGNVLPVHLYIGGLEHATLHLFFARFFSHFISKELKLYDNPEPFKQLLMTGLIKGQTFQKPNGEFIAPKNAVFDEETKNFKLDSDSSVVLTETFDKMSKSKYNGLNPEDIIEEFGWSSIRALILCKAKPDANFEWGDTNHELVGIGRWMNKLWHLVTRRREALGLPSYVENTNKQNIHKENIGKVKYENELILKSVDFETKYQKDSKKINNARKQMIKRCEKVIEVECGEWAKYCTTLISTTDLMIKFSNNSELAAHSDEYFLACVDLIRLISPVCPMYAAELWAGLATTAPSGEALSNYDFESDILEQSWPVLEGNISRISEVKEKKRSKQKKTRD